MGIRWGNIRSKEDREIYDTWHRKAYVERKVKEKHRIQESLRKQRRRRLLQEYGLLLQQWEEERKPFKKKTKVKT